jgi:hypothetical protein
MISDVFIFPVRSLEDKQNDTFYDWVNKVLSGDERHADSRL